MERDSKEGWIFALVLASAASTLVSIAVSEILGAMACVLWIVFRPKPIHLPRYVWPLLAFMIATLLSLAMSPDPNKGMAQINKFVLFPMGLLAANFVSTPDRAKLSYRVLMIVAAASSMVALVQFGVAYAHFLQTGLREHDPMVLARAKGFMSHWMTFSVGEMLVWLAVAPAIAVWSRRWILPLIVIGAGIVLSFTRGVWIGCAAGFLPMAFTLPRKAIASILVPVAAVALIAAGPIYHRVMMSTEPRFTPDTGRVALLQAGVLMVRDHPLFGVGPDRIHDEFPRYHSDPEDLKNYFYGHMENNYMQIAAERGLIALAAFVWFFWELLAGLWRLLKNSEGMERTAAISGLSVLIGFLVAGLFSYDFGDSETLLLFLFLVSIPFGLAGKPDTATNA